MRWVQIVAELRELMTFSLRNTNLTFMLYCLCARRRQVSCPRYKIEAHNQHINNLSFRPECPICCQGLYITTTLHWVCSRVQNNFNMVHVSCFLTTYTMLQLIKRPLFIPTDFVTIVAAWKPKFLFSFCHVFVQAGAQVNKFYSFRQLARPLNCQVQSLEPQEISPGSRIFRLVKPHRPVCLPFYNAMTPGKQRSPVVVKFVDRTNH